MNEPSASVLIAVSDFKINSKQLFNFWNKVDKHGPTPQHRPELGPCWIWNGSRTNDGYGALFLNGRKEMAHRVSWMIINGPFPKEMIALHGCDNPSCVNPVHLSAGTHQNNYDDMMLKGRDRRSSGGSHYYAKHPELIAKGESNGKSKLNTEKVLAIRANFVQGNTSHISNAKQLAKEYGVDVSQIRKIVNRRFWKHVP